MMNEDKKRNKRNFPTVLSSMRRHLPKSTHTLLDNAAVWSTSLLNTTTSTSSSTTTARQPHRSTAGFHVKMPTRLLFWTISVFLLLPLTVFLYKEIHISDTTSSSMATVVHNKEQHSHLRDSHPAWMQELQQQQNNVTQQLEASKNVTAQEEQEEPHQEEEEAASSLDKDNQALLLVKEEGEEESSEEEKGAE